MKYLIDKCFLTTPAAHHHITSTTTPPPLKTPPTPLPPCTHLFRTDNCARTVRRQPDYDKIAQAFAAAAARLRSLGSLEGEAAAAALRCAGLRACLSVCLFVCLWMGGLGWAWVWMGWVGQGQERES